MLKNKRLVSFVAMLAICFSFLVPAFMAPDQAAAASTYTVLSAPTVGAGSATPLGAVEIYVPSIGSFVQDKEVLTVSLPTGVKMPDYVMPTLVTDTDKTDYKITGDSIKIEFPKTVDSAPNAFHDNSVSVKLTSACTFDIIVEKAGFTNYPDGSLTGDPEAGKMRLYFTKFDTTGYSGDITATFVPPLNGNGFTAGSAIIGKVSSTQGTTAYVKSVKTVSKGNNQTIDTIIIAETALQSITSGESIKLKLPSGYEWTTSSYPPYSYIGGSWGFQNQSSLSGSNYPGFSYTINGRELIVKKWGGYSTGYEYQTGRINIGIETWIDTNGDSKADTEVGLFRINVPDTAANGDVVCSITAGEKTDGITDQEVVIAKVGDYGITVSEGDKTEVVSGKKEQKLGSFYIEESLAGSLINGRSVKLTLPDGCKWDTAPQIEVASSSGKDVLGSGSINTTDYKTVTYTISGTTTDATKLKLKDGKIQISPSFSGPVKITVSGSAGVSGEVTVAECKPIVTMTADADKKMIIGLPNQVASDITITEGTKGAIMDSTDGVTNNYFKLSLPDGVTFSSKPTVKVVEGDLDIDSYKLTDNDQALQITIKSSSTKASKIVISDVKLTLNRTVPEGQLKAKLSTYDDTYALDETTLFSTKDSAGSVVIGTCVTPAPANQGRSALFTIGSNIATINGSYVIMDAAPYIKGSRTYIPVRYLADALGATTQWDPATQTATLTLGDKSVVLVIGSKVEKVNGADVTMDVAPEIVNGRTMLPARYVAEGLGYQVGWNGVTKQVIIQ